MHVTKSSVVRWRCCAVVCSKAKFKAGSESFAPCLTCVFCDACIPGVGALYFCADPRYVRTTATARTSCNCRRNHALQCKNRHVAAPDRTRAMQCSVGSMHSLAAVGQRLRQGLESGGVERGVVCEQSAGGVGNVRRLDRGGNWRIWGMRGMWCRGGGVAKQCREPAADVAQRAVLG